MKLWVFGDSYSIPLDYIDSEGAIRDGVDAKKYHTNWIEELSNNLHVDELKIYSNFGVSNECIFKNVAEQSNNFSLEDYVIVQLTNSNRHWWFPDDPAESNLPQMISNPEWSKEKQKAIELHLKYLQNDNMDNLIYSSVIYSFMYIKLVLPGIKMLLLPGWGAGPDTIGNLTVNVCDAEFDNRKTQQMFYNKTGYDFRLNHMTIDNHLILSSKILNYFKNPAPIDLTTGFKTKIYTKDNI